MYICVHVTPEYNLCVICQELSMLFFETGLSMAWNFPARLGYLAGEPQGVTWLCLPGLVYQVFTITSRLFTWVLRSDL